jgi:hypothetical protein
MTRVTPLALLAMACSTVPTDTDAPYVPDPDEEPIIFVGNPGSTVTVGDVAVPDLGGLVRLDELDLWPCDDGEPARLSPGLRFLPDPTPFNLPTGTWCGMSLRLAGHTLLSGLDPSGALFDLSFEPMAIDLPFFAPLELSAEERSEPDDPFSAYTIELGEPGWATLATDLLPTQDVDIGPGHPLYGPLLHQLRQGTHLYNDTNGDGRTDPEERSDKLAAPPDDTLTSWFFALTDTSALTRGKADGSLWQPDVPVRGPGSLTVQLDDVALGEARYVAVGQTSDYRRAFATSETGRTWHTWTTPGNRLSDLTWGEGRFVAVGEYDSVAWSDDGLRWTDVPAEDGTYWKDVAYGGGRFVAVGVTSGGRGVVSVSTDGGEQWTDLPDVGAGTETEGVWLYGVAWDGTRFVAVGLQGRRMRSTDGLTWTADTLGDNDLTDLTHDGTRFIAASAGAVELSSDGLVWERYPAPGFGPVAAGPNGYLRVTSSQTLARSSDLTLGSGGWTLAHTEPTHALRSVVFLAP